MIAGHDMMASRFVPRRRVVGLVAVMAVACHDTPGDPGPAPGLVRIGVAERGGVIVYRVRDRAGDTTTTTPAALSVEPAAAATIWRGTDSLRFERTGRVLVRLAGTTLVDTVEVGEPPWLVFDADTAGNRDIWAMRLDGSERRRLTTEPSDDRDPTAAGGQVVFVSGRSGALDLWRVPLGGGAATALTATPEADGAPALARNGDRLAWLTGNGPSLVRVGSGDATGNARFAPATTTLSNNDEFSPAISPSGDRIAFATIRTGRVQVLVGAVGGAAGSAELATRDDSAVVSEPSFSPDGSRLVVTRTVQRAGQPDRSDLVFVTLAGGARTPLTTSGSATRPKWLPDGRIVFRESSSPGPRFVWVDPARPTRLVPIPSGGLVPRAVDAAR